MRLKTFHAETMTEAMALVRNELGDESIIVSTNDSGRDGVRITAAVESLEPNLAQNDGTEAEKPLEQICEAMDRHGTPRGIADRLLNAAALLGTNDLIPIFAGALDLLFDFSPLSEAAPKRPVMLFGPPGSGKTSAAAKLAACAVVNGTAATLITTDSLRAGAVPQLQAYGDRLNCRVESAIEPPGLAKIVAATPPGQRVLIDTTSVNPFAGRDMVRLTAFAEAVESDRVLVMSAGRDATEAGEIAAEFSKLAPSRLLVTGLDMTRRLGGLLTAADACQAAFSDFSETPEILDGLRPVNPVALARLFLERSQFPGAGVSRQSNGQHRQSTGWK